MMQPQQRTAASWQGLCHTFGMHMPLLRCKSRSATRTTGSAATGCSRMLSCSIPRTCKPPHP